MWAFSVRPSLNPYIIIVYHMEPSCPVNWSDHQNVMRLPNRSLGLMIYTYT